MSKIKVTVEIIDSNNNVTYSKVEETNYIQNQNEDIELELVHDQNGGPLVRPKKRPKY